MELELIPYEAVGPIRFGADRQAVATTLGGEGELFESEGETVENFFEQGVEVVYDDDGGVEMVGVKRSSSLTWEGLPFQPGARLEQLFAELEKRDLELVQMDPDQWKVPKLGTTVWSEDGETVTTVGAFVRPDYYDD